MVVSGRDKPKDVKMRKQLLVAGMVLGMITRGDLVLTAGGNGLKRDREAANGTGIT